MYFFTTIFRGSSAVLCAVNIPPADLRKQINGRNINGTWNNATNKLKNIFMLSVDKLHLSQCVDFRLLYEAGTDVRTFSIWHIIRVELTSPVNSITQDTKQF
jgi:hypothetical protein